VVIKHRFGGDDWPASVFAIFMSWGKILSRALMSFFLNTFPMYNKFRAPSMSLVVAQLVIPVAAVLAVQKLFFEAN
jgi:hypothetical protein